MLTDGEQFRSRGTLAEAVERDLGAYKQRRSGFYKTLQQEISADQKTCRTGELRAAVTSLDCRPSMDLGPESRSRCSFVGDNCRLATAAF